MAHPTLARSDVLRRLASKKVDGKVEGTLKRWKKEPSDKSEVQWVVPVILSSLLRQAAEHTLHIPTHVRQDRGARQGSDGKRQLGSRLRVDG
jgi:hypothetical protein